MNNIGSYRENIALLKNISSARNACFVDPLIKRFFPIVNAYNNRSYLNISGQWVRSTAPGYIKENIFRINIGLTFNERWFAKWKVD